MGFSNQVVITPTGANAADCTGAIHLMATQPHRKCGNPHRKNQAQEDPRLNPSSHRSRFPLGVPLSQSGEWRDQTARLDLLQAFVCIKQRANLTIAKSINVISRSNSCFEEPPSEG